MARARKDEAVMASTDNTTEQRRDHNWKRDSSFDGRYLETRQIHVRRGPSAGQTKAALNFLVGDELVTVWPPAVLRRMLREELERRDKPDFEPGERIQITTKGLRDGASGSYWDFEEPIFEHGGPKPSAASILGGGGEDQQTSDVPADGSEPP
jgi:hypothetical protein